MLSKRSGKMHQKLSVSEDKTENGNGVTLCTRAYFGIDAFLDLSWSCKGMGTRLSGSAEATPHVGYLAQESLFAVEQPTGGGQVPWEGWLS